MISNRISIKINILGKRLSEKQKEEISVFFTEGESIEDIASKFECTKLTITRTLKKLIGDEKYKELLIKRKPSSLRLINNKNSSSQINGNLSKRKNVNKKNADQNQNNDSFSEESFAETKFFEIPPLNCEVESSPQKDLSSIPISEVDFPKIVYLVVDRNIELEIKYLKDFPDWQFLAQEELNRKTIEIFLDLKIAKRFCTKDQKVIKVPNTNVFKIVAPILVSKGISRIVSSDKLIAL
tara:strand:+ start:29351 stop:30067 length:717 start_codon:yes stop_codon:yes gene_type:complete